MSHLSHLRSTTAVAAGDPADPGTATSHLAAVPTTASETRGSDEDGSLVAEYGLIAVVAATIAGILITWGRGALPGFFDELIEGARGLVL